MVLTRSENGGVTWSPTATAEVWPTGTSYGMVAKPDGSLLVWFTNVGITTYLRSIDHGQTFMPDTGPPAPGGTIVQVRDGYITLGTEPVDVPRRGRPGQPPTCPMSAASTERLF